MQSSPGLRARLRLASGALAAALILGFTLAACAPASGRSTTRTPDRGTNTESTRNPIAPTAKPKKLPKNGKVIWLTSKANTRILKSNISNGGKGTLTVSVPNSGRAYYIKLVEKSPGWGDVLGVVIAPGRSVTVQVPLNGDEPTSYELRYAAGTDWFGRNKTFGPEGLYAIADETFTFERGTGWRVELSLRVGGNLGQTGLDYGQF